MLELVKFLGLPNTVTTLLESILMTFAVILAIVGIFLAFWGYKFIKVMLIIGSTVGVAIASNLLLVPLFLGKIADVSFFSISGIIVTVATVLVALISYKCPRLIIFLAGAGAGFLLLGPILAQILVALAPGLAFLSTPIGSIILNAVIALICAILVCIFFKFLIILLTSLIGAALTTAGIFTLIFSKGLLVMAIPAIVVIVALTIVAMVFQYVRARKNYSPVYY